VSPRPLLLFGTALLLLAGSRVGAAQTLTVNPPTAGPLTINTAVAGQEPTGVAAGGGTYTVGVKKNKGITRITARLSAPLPAGTTLSITLAAPGGGALSVGAVQLTTSAQSVVTNLPDQSTTFFNNAITYSFNANSSAGVLALQTATVILELAP
jgi:hypothetical protein